MRLSPKRVYLDTNILVGDFLHRYPQYVPPKGLANDPNRRHCWEAIQFVRRDKAFVTCLAAFSVPRLASLLAQLKVPRAEAIAELERLVARNSIVGLSKLQLSATLTEFRDQAHIRDVEDCFQYAACRDARCFYLLTLNKKDFAHFLNVNVLHPKLHRLINY